MVKDENYGRLRAYDAQREKGGEKGENTMHLFRNDHGENALTYLSLNICQTHTLCCTCTGGGDKDKAQPPPLCNSQSCGRIWRNKYIMAIIHDERYQWQEGSKTKAWEKAFEGELVSCGVGGS